MTDQVKQDIAGGPGDIGGAAPELNSANIADRLGDGFADGDFLRVQNTDMVSASLKESTLSLDTGKNVRAKKFQAAEKTLELGEALGIGAAGGEVLYHDMTTGTEQHFLGPRKPYSNTNGTAGSFTSGRVISAFTTIVLQPGDTILSDSVTAQVGVNTDPLKVKFLYTIADPTDVMVTQLIGRFNAAQTGVRMVIRHTSATGQIIFTSEPEWTYITNSGISVSGTGDTTFDTEENPLLFRSGSTYHITIESNVGAVVMKGAMVSGAFVPYLSRRRATVLHDPVVARGAETLTTAQTFDALDWYETKYCNGTFAVRLPPIAASAGLDITLVNIGTGVITVNDNVGVNLDAVLPGEVAIFESDGTTIRRVNRDRINEVTALAETIAGVEARVGVIETSGDDTGPDNGLMASVASLVSFDAADAQSRVDADESITETIAAIESRIDVLEDDVDETGPDNGLMAAVASLASQVQALDIPVLESVQSAIASIISRLEALAIPPTEGLEAAVASLRDGLDRLDIPATTGLDAAVASLSSGAEVERQTRNDADDSVTESLAGIEASVDGNATESQNADAAIHAAVASISSGEQVEQQRRNDADVSITESIAGIEADLAARRQFSRVTKTDSTSLIGTAGTYGDVPLAASGAALALTLTTPGRYRLTQSVRVYVAAAVVGSANWVTTRLFNQTSGAAVADSDVLILANDNTVAAQVTGMMTTICLCGGSFNFWLALRLRGPRGSG